jgi:GxxExxY protein
MRDIDLITGDVIDLAIRLHKALGPGLLETVYETLLAAKLEEAGYHVARQRPIDIEFEGIRFEAAFRADIIVNNQLIIEVKSLEKLRRLYTLQTRQNYGIGFP